MINTKAFAELCDTTKKTIIHYDRIGLIKPALNEAGWRFYKSKQVLTFQKICLLKSFGLTLSEIKKYLSSNNLLGLFEQREKDLKDKKEVLEKRLQKIKEFTANFKKGQPMVTPKIKKVKPYSFYGIRKEGRYVDISSHQKELFNLIGDTKYKQVGLTLFFNNKYSPANAKMITGALIKSKSPKKIPGVSLAKVSSYKTVAYLHVGPYTYMSYIWQFLDKFVQDNKLKLHPKLVCRELYIIGSHVEKNEDNLITELQIPII